ncbi:34560_t:CDS:2 [Gigaspora margarita]|uniref:34560_t:CDS:1 n=1 Tax=Gigaspora margarita TaxID=4874 RepID=A0ABN7USZ4_GIGMA|nr:34560_t:CDS:2 [Gigaspora margarita]
MLHQIAINTDINLVDHKITNHSARRTAIMLLKASDTPEDKLMAFSGHRSHEGIRSYSRPTDDQRLNAVATLIPFAMVEEDLEEYYNFPGESYIIYESEEDVVETKISVTSTATTTSSESEIEVTAISNKSINNDKNVSQHKASKSIQTFSPFKPPSKKAKISSSKSQQHYSQKNQLLNAQERSYNTQENQSYNIQENRSCNTQENQLYNTQDNQSYNIQKNQENQNLGSEVSDNSNIVSDNNKPRSALASITNNVILQILPTDKPLTINLNLTFGR